MALGAPGLALARGRSRVAPSAARRAARARRGAPRAARAQALAVDRHHVVEVQPDPDQAIGAGAVEGGHDERQWAHQVRRERHHQLALEQRLAHEPEVEVLQVAQPSVDELARAAGGPRGEVGALEQRDAVAARGGVQRDARAGDAAADHDDIELVLRQRRESLAALDHAPQSRRAGRGSARAAPPVALHAGLSSARLPRALAAHGEQDRGRAPLMRGRRSRELERSRPTSSPTRRSRERRPASPRSRPARTCRVHVMQRSPCVDSAAEPAASIATAATPIDASRRPSRGALAAREHAHDGGASWRRSSTPRRPTASARSRGVLASTVGAGFAAAAAGCAGRSPRRSP